MSVGQIVTIRGSKERAEIKRIAGSKCIIVFIDDNDEWIEVYGEYKQRIIELNMLVAA